MSMTNSEVVRRIIQKSSLPPTQQWISLDQLKAVAKELDGNKRRRKC